MRFRERRALNRLCRKMWLAFKRPIEEKKIMVWLSKYKESIWGAVPLPPKGSIQFLSSVSYPTIHFLLMAFIPNHIYYHLSVPSLKQILSQLPVFSFLFFHLNSRLYDWTITLQWHKGQQLQQVQSYFFFVSSLTSVMITLFSQVANMQKVWSRLLSIIILHWV